MSFIGKYIKILSNILDFLIPFFIDSHPTDGTNMNVFYNSEKLLALISNIYELSGIWINIHELSGRDIQIRNQHTAFCRAINDTPEGHARCVDCDAKSAEICQRLKLPYHYRCHAGICETLIPIFDSGDVIAYLGFGQLLDETPLEEQWKHTQKTLTWYPGDMEELHKKFFDIRQYSQKKTLALTAILQTLATYVQSSGAVALTKFSDQQFLEIYLAQHYTEKLTLKQISEDLGFGTTKLCALAKNLSKGHSLTWLIAHYRIEAAKKLLTSSDKPISEIALLTGYEDYNYFTKVFKNMVGITPSKYRSTLQ